MMKCLTRSVPLVALAALWSAATPSGAEAALAGSAGNTVVRNTITVNYNDARGNVQSAVSSSVDITVSTVAATPTIMSVTPSPGSTDGTGATQLYTFRVRTNSNGPGSISFGTSDGSFTNIAAGTIPTVPGAIYLGSTILDPGNFPALGAQNVAPNATITVAVPNDGGKADDAGASHTLPDSSVINGIAVNDTVYLTDGSSYFGPWQVTAVSDPAVPATATGSAVPPGSLTLRNLSGGNLAFTPAYGWQVVEAQDVAVTVTQGAVPTATANNPASWVTTLTATMAGAPAANTPTALTNAHMGRIAITKYVRNATRSVTGSGSSVSVTINGAANTYYTGGVSGNPKDVLEYLAVLTDDGTGNSTAVYATDVMPLYATLVTGSSYGAGGSGTVFARARFGSNEVDLKTDNSAGLADTAYGKSTGTGAGSTMSFNLGAGCSNLFPGGGGTLTPGQTAYVVYQVRID